MIKPQLQILTGSREERYAVKETGCRMLTSLLLGLIVMVLYKPRTWCAFCPMGTMTQGICKLKNKE